MAHRPVPTLLLCAAVIAVAAPAAAADPEPVWDLKLGLSYVATSGNSDTSTTGASVDYNRRFSLWSLAAFASAVNVTEADATTAERYVLGARAAYPVTGRLSLVGGVKGEKDRFAGIDLRTLADAGVEYVFLAGEPVKVTGLAGATWTTEDPRFGDSHDWLGALAGIKAAWKLSDTAAATGQGIFYPNFDETDDWRAEAAVGVQATLTDLLSLKFGWELRYDNQPVAGFTKTDTVTLASLVLTTKSDQTR